jgi:putative acetyltransferase
VHEIRDARDDDAAALIELIGAVYSEYPGCILDVDGEMPELRAIASTYGAVGGRLWVAEGAVVGASGGFVPSVEPGGLEVRKLYVRKDWRGQGIASTLLAMIENEARRRGARFIDLWTDTRFTTAHRLYERVGFLRGTTRTLADVSKSVEYYYRKPLTPSPAS